MPTFGEALERTLESIEKEVRTPERLRAWLHPLEKHALPRLRDIQVDRIGRQEVLEVVEPLWNTKHETARQVRRKIRRVLSWAEGHGFVNVNYAGPVINGALQSRGRNQEHYRSAPYDRVPEVWRTISAASGSPAVRLCLQLLLGTAVRTGEARLADWSEIDFAKREWRIPEERTKTKMELYQPLSSPALEVLEQAKGLSGASSPSGYVFPSPVKRGEPLSPPALLYLLDPLQSARPDDGARPAGQLPDMGVRANGCRLCGDGTEFGSQGRLKRGKGVRSRPTRCQTALPNGAVGRVPHWNSPGLGVPHRHLARCRAPECASPRRCTALGSNFRSVAWGAV